MSQRRKRLKAEGKAKKKKAKGKEKGNANCEDDSRNRRRRRGPGDDDDDDNDNRRKTPRKRHRRRKSRTSSSRSDRSGSRVPSSPVSHRRKSTGHRKKGHSKVTGFGARGQDEVALIPMKSSFLLNKVRVAKHSFGKAVGIVMKTRFAAAKSNRLLENKLQGRLTAKSTAPRKVPTPSNSWHKLCSSPQGPRRSTRISQQDPKKKTVNGVPIDLWKKDQDRLSAVLEREDSEAAASKHREKAILKLNAKSSNMFRLLESQPFLKGVVHFAGQECFPFFKVRTESLRPKSKTVYYQSELPLYTVQYDLDGLLRNVATLYSSVAQPFLGVIQTSPHIVVGGVRLQTTATM